MVLRLRLGTDPAPANPISMRPFSSRAPRIVADAEEVSHSGGGVDRGGHLAPLPLVAINHPV